MKAPGEFTVKFPLRYKVAAPILNSPVAVAVVPAELTVKFPKIPTELDVHKKLRISDGLFLLQNKIEYNK